MKQTINFSQFVDAFKAIRPDNFTYDALKALFTYLEDIESITEKEIELDVISLCSEFTEYEDIKDFHRYNDRDEYPNIEALEQIATVIPISYGFIVADF